MFIPKTVRIAAKRPRCRVVSATTAIDAPGLITSAAAMRAYVLYAASNIRESAQAAAPAYRYVPWLPVPTPLPPEGTVRGGGGGTYFQFIMLLKIMLNS